jgi:uncharacterized protein (UPF0276 family)
MMRDAGTPYFAVNYSKASASLLRRGRIQVDRFKCPAWPDVIREAQAEHAAYVHFPLRVGPGEGSPINTETGGPPDWDAFKGMMEETETPWISVHLGPRPADHPDIPPQSTDPAHVARITEAVIRDLEAVVDEVGAERVVAENIFEYHGMHLRAAVLPEVVTRIVEATGCGLLLDISHARLAARDLGVAPWSYMDALPVDRIREIHVTGIQRFDAAWVRRLEAQGAPQAKIDELSGREIDHLPMTPKDWDVLARALDRIETGAWACPAIIAFEYGGIGPFFQALTRASILSQQIPRMYERVHTIRESECLQQEESLYV